MSKKLTIEDLAVESFAATPGTEHGSAGDYQAMDHTYEDPCFSRNGACSWPCIEPSGLTNYIYCCG